MRIENPEFLLDLSEQVGLEPYRRFASLQGFASLPSLQGLPWRVYTVSKMLRRSGYKHYQN